MPIRHAIWKVADQPQQLTESSLTDEQLLEKMIVAELRRVDANRQAREHGPWRAY
jgi:hypothetical protein